MLFWESFRERKPPTDLTIVSEHSTIFWGIGGLHLSLEWFNPSFETFSWSDSLVSCAYSRSIVACGPIVVPMDSMPLHALLGPCLALACRVGPCHGIPCLALCHAHVPWPMCLACVPWCLACVPWCLAAPMSSAHGACQPMVPAPMSSAHGASAAPMSSAHGASAHGACQRPWCQRPWCLPASCEQRP